MILAPTKFTMQSNPAIVSSMGLAVCSECPHAEPRANNRQIMAMRLSAAKA